MPPRRSNVSQSKVKTDPHKHDKALKEIEQRLEKERLADEETVEEEFIEEEDEYCEEEFEIEPLENEDALTVGCIDMSFPEAVKKFSNFQKCYPPSYYTLSYKERLLLVYAENYRYQDVLRNVKRRPLVLAIPNECGIQKFVCTTIRPTAFPYIPLIRDAKGIASFVADFIEYEPLKDMYSMKFVCTTIRPTAFPYKSLIRNDQNCASFVADFIIYEPLTDMMSCPKRLISPSTLLRVRRGNSFEMATLLCSMLIGAGYPAVVVSGVARAEVVENDQRNTPYPYDLPKIVIDEDAKEKPKTGQKYKLKPLPDLESHLSEAMEKLLEEKAAEEQKIKDEAMKRHLEEMEIRIVDQYHFRRSHAWVAIIDNAPWSIKPKRTHLDENGDKVDDPPTARFIEPSTGFESTNPCKQYILIDSVWNQYNYYVNMQKYERVTEIRWDLRNLNDWEHILPGEPPEMRTYSVHSDENLADVERPIEEEHHLDTIRSWVMKLHIGEKEFDERFLKLEKTVLYKRVKHERFSPYSQCDGKVMKLTFYSDDEYEVPTECWDFYENRLDKLTTMKYTYENNDIEEVFAKGRNDSLKYMRYKTDPNKAKDLYFYSAARLDSLYKLTIETGRLTLEYRGRHDLCYYQEYAFKPVDMVLRKFIEKFHRNPDVPADADISTRAMMMQQQKIIIKYHYAKGALTASTCEFVKPTAPDYGKEIIYDPTLVKTYKANVANPDFTPLELYRLILREMKIEEKVHKKFQSVYEEINTVLDKRKSEAQAPVLTFRIFDALRNGAARQLRLQKKADEEAYKKELQTKPADFLAPYLVSYKDRDLTYNEAYSIYKACLSDMKSRFVFLLNDLQRQYEDLLTESKSLKRFLHKFEDQFNNYDYEQLVAEAKQISLNQRMVQQRLALTHEESQKKYEMVKEALKNDPRLNLSSFLSGKNK